MKYCLTTLKKCLYS